MSIEIDRKEGTEPEYAQKKKKTVTLDRRVIYGWWVFLVSVAAWMFYLGIIVGRESAPVYFNGTQLDSDLMAMVSSTVNPENTDVVLPETTESQDLEFFEALKDNKGGNKKIAELEALQSKSKLAAMQPERLPAKALGKDEETSSPADVPENVHSLKSKDASTGKLGEKNPASAKDAKAPHDKSDKKKDEKKPDNKKVAENKKGPENKKTSENKKPDDKKHDGQKNDPKKSEKEKTADAIKKESKTVPDAAKNSHQKQETKVVAVTDKSKDQKKQPEIKNNVSEAAAKKAEKSADALAAKNPELIKITPAVKEQPQKTLEPVKHEKTKEATVAKSGDAKTGIKPADQHTVKKEQPKTGKYSIQAGAYTTQNDAAAYAKKLSSAGYSASVVKGKGSDGKDWYRIRVGTYGDKEKAVKMAETIKGAGFPAMVINVPQE